MLANRWWRNLVGGASVLATMLTVGFGLPALDRAVPVGHDPGQRHHVTPDVSVIPPVGALIARQSRSGEQGSILFLVGPARYVVAASPNDRDLTSAASRLRTKIQGMRGYQVTSPEYPVSTDSGLQGLGGTFTAPGRNGRYVAFVAPQRVIEVTVTGSDSDFAQALIRIDDSIASIAHHSGAK